MMLGLTGLSLTCRQTSSSSDVPVNGLTDDDGVTFLLDDDGSTYLTDD